MTNSLRAAKAVLFTRCCDGDATAEELWEMYEREREIQLTTFRRRTNVGEISGSLGYVAGRHAKGLRLQQDRCVRFYRSTFRGLPCFYMDWSAIDHIFMRQEHIDELRKRS